MSKKQKIINEIFQKNNSHLYNNLFLFTKKFKAIGEFCKDNCVKNIISLQNVKIYFYGSNCECETNPAAKELPWLNVFAKEIIAFSFVEK